MSEAVVVRTEISPSFLPDLPGVNPSKSLIDSIEKYGVLQPIGIVLSENEEYQIGFGRRRLMAAKILNLPSIPVIQFYGIPVAVLTLIENEHRSDNLAAQLNAIAILRLKMPIDYICVHLGINRARINKCVRILDSLIPELMHQLQQGQISDTVAVEASKLPSSQQHELLNHEKVTGTIIKQIKRAKKKALVDALPGEIFEAPSWREQAIEQVTRLEAVVPEDSPHVVTIAMLKQNLMTDSQ